MAVTKYGPTPAPHPNPPHSPSYTPKPAPPGIGAPGSGMTSTQADAWAQLQSTLRAYGFSGNDLTALIAWARNEVVRGNSPAQIGLDLMQTPQFATRFPAIVAREKAGLPPVSVAEYLSLERSYSELERAAGIPVNFHDYDQLIANDVSPAEMSDRINKGYLAVARADPTVVKAFQDYYGVTQGQLAAYFMDPKRALPLLEQQATAAQIGGAATMSGFRGADQGGLLHGGGVAPGLPISTTNQIPNLTQVVAGTGGLEAISPAEALRLAQMGVTQAQAQQGFRQLTQEAQLYTALPGQGGVGHPLSTDQLLNAQFGSDGQTQLQLQLQAEFEKGTTAQGTQVGQTAGGATGVGAVQR